jgi:purine-binding chemotaxis protein CheW
MTGPTQKTGDLTVLTLSIGKQMLAIPAANLREILDPLPRTRVPGADQAAPWVLNVRGAVVPLADLRIPLGIMDQLSPDEDSDTRRFVVLEVEIGSDTATVAILADVVHDVTTIPSDQIEPLPAASQFPAGFLTGLYRGADSFVLLPDLSAIFTTLAQRSAAA